MKRISSLLLAVVFFYQNAIGASSSDFRYDHFVVDNVAFDYQILKTKEQFISKFGANLRPEDRQELEKSLQTMKALPKLVANGNWMKFYGEGYTLTLDLNRAWNKIIVVNGIQTALDTKSPLAPQVKVLIEKIKRNGREVSRMDLILPKAYAIAPLIIAGLAFIGMTVGGVVVNRYAGTSLDLLDYNVCWVMEKKVKWIDENSPICKEYIKTQKELASKNPEVKAVQDALKDVSVTDPIEVSVETCAHRSSDQTYRSEVQFIKEGVRARVEVTFDPEKKVKEFKVLEYDSENIVATYILKDQILQSIRVPNPNAGKSTGGVLEPADIEISATDEIKDPLISAKQKMNKNLFQKIGQRLGACKSRADNLETTHKKQTEANAGTK